MLKRVGIWIRYFAWIGKLGKLKEIIGIKYGRDRWTRWRNLDGPKALQRMDQEAEQTKGRWLKG